MLAVLSLRDFVFSDPDGDDLSIHIGSTPRYGTAGVMVSGDNGHYNVTPTYQLSNEAIREIHQSRDDLVDTFTVSTTATVVLEDPPPDEPGS